MKKLLALFMVVVLCVTLCACGSESNGSDLNESNATDKATIIDNEGNTVEMTHQEILDASKNEIKFKSLYRGADITFVGTISEIKSGDSIDTIIFEEGWKVLLLEGYHDDFLSTADIGSKVQVSSNIFDALVCVEVVGMSSSVGYTEDSMKKNTLTLVE